MACLRGGNSITSAHSMENYRHLLGKQMGENFSPTVYFDALKSQLGVENRSALPITPRR